MKKILIRWLSCFLGVGVGSAVASDLPAVSHYSLRLQLFPSEQRMEAEAQITITNHTPQSVSEVPFLLYRLLEVKSVTSDVGSLIKYSQSIQKFTDNPMWQANLVRLELSEPLLPLRTTNVKMKYAGSVFGYPEVRQYLRDRIDEKYSLIRLDALTYPVLSLPSEKDFNPFLVRFGYDLQVTVPSEYTVACGGLLKRKEVKENTAVFTYQSKVPAWRMDIAAARFKLLSDETNQLFVYALPGDERGAAPVLNSMKKVLEFYSGMLGEMKRYEGYTCIEVPNGWGSQASDYCLLQQAAAFKDTNKMAEVYHEIAHAWNVRVKDEIQRCRWFDEAFAEYFAALAVREFNGDSAFRKHVEELSKRWVRDATNDKRNYDTPIAQYAKEELGQNSYTKGAWALYVLHQLIGEEAFRQTLRSFLAEFAAKPADFKDFQSAAEKRAGRDLSKFFSEWIYGAQSSQLLADKVPIAEIVKRY